MRKSMCSMILKFVKGDNFRAPNILSFFFLKIMSDEVVILTLSFKELKA